MYMLLKDKLENKNEIIKFNEKYNYTASFFSDRNLDTSPYIPEKGSYKFIISNNTVNLVIKRNHF